jgi:hypothetical protein
MKFHVAVFALVSAVALLAGLPAQAAGTLTRTFVSSAGVDSNPCTVPQPCATFQAAYNAVASGGIVAALDPGKYSSLTISGPVTINGNGWSAITAMAGSTGITINANSGDQVILTGIEIDGAGAGRYGIVFNSGASLTVTHCILENFVSDGGNDSTGSGLLIAPTAGTENITIADTVAANAIYGIAYYPLNGSASANIALDRVLATGNSSFAVYLFPIDESSGTLSVAMTNSVVSNNGSGVAANTTPAVPVTVSIEGTSVTGNSSIGVAAQNATTMYLSNSVLTANGIGALNNTTSNTLYTYSNNEIHDNGTEIQGYGGVLPTYAAQ